MTELQSFKELNEKDSFSEDLFIREAVPKKTKAGASYFTFELVRRDGEMIRARQWGVSSLGAVKADEVYLVSGKVEIYNGNHYLTISDFAESEVPSSEFPRESPLTTNELIFEFRRYYASIGDHDLSKVVEYTIEKLGGYFEAKAAKAIHHSFKGGLAYHSLTMANAADMLSRIYSVDRDLLVTAAILHDAGKVIELDETGYTKEGTLYGHIIIMNDILSEVIFKNENLAKSEKIAHLKHILLAHHGRLEWGSPVQGATPEAILFHHIDKIDADMMIAKTELAKIDQGETTQRIWSLDNRVLYKF